MGHVADVFGYILGRDDFAKENEARIAALPEHDTRPEITRDMFAVPTREHSYLSQLISFGRSYNGVENHWEAWLTKFEALLRGMYWDEAHVYLKTELWGSFHYVWTPKPDTPLPNQEWTFSGGPRSGIRDTYRPP